MQDELDIISHRKVWSLVPLPKGKKSLGTRWIFSKKRNERGEIVRYKARLVAQGYRQQPGINYEETYSPVASFSVIRLFFSILVCHLKWTHVQLDVKAAYLYAKLKDETYVKQPPGFVSRLYPNHVFKLHKALYGLHQAGRQWFFELHNVLLSLGFTQLKFCNCVYTLNSNVILMLYVDDMVILSKNENLCKKTTELIASKFDIKVLGKTNRLLGVDFVEKEFKVSLHQHAYIDKICEHFSKFNFPVSSVPVAKGSIFSKSQCPSTDNERTEMSKYPYRSLIGCLAYIANRTRPDISYAVNLLSQFQENPGVIHWNAALKLLGYLKYTRDFELNLANIQNLNISCYCDADYASNRDDRVSIGGLILYVSGAPILWRTTKQKCVSLSSMEAEFISVTEASKEVIWVSRILNECHDKIIFSRDDTTDIIFCDNISAINFCKSPIENARTKHIHVRYHFVRSLIYEEKFQIKYISTKKNPADYFTKPQTKERFKQFYDLNFK